MRESRLLRTLVVIIGTSVLGACDDPAAPPVSDVSGPVALAVEGNVVRGGDGLESAVVRIQAIEGAANCRGALLAEDVTLTGSQGSFRMLLRTDSVYASPIPDHGVPACLQVHVRPEGSSGWSLLEFEDVSFRRPTPPDTVTLTVELPAS